MKTRRPSFVFSMYILPLFQSPVAASTDPDTRLPVCKGSLWRSTSFLGWVIVITIHYYGVCRVVRNFSLVISSVGHPLEELILRVCAVWCVSSVWTFWRAASAILIYSQYNWTKINIAIEDSALPSSSLYTVVCGHRHLRHPSAWRGEVIHQAG